MAYVIMRKSADLTVISYCIDTERKPQKISAKAAAVHKNVKGKLHGRKKCGRKKYRTIQFLCCYYTFYNQIGLNI